MNTILAIAKKPETWVILVLGIIAASAYSALRKPFLAISSKLPGSDLAGN
jgi:hypothetical protein